MATTSPEIIAVEQDAQTVRIELLVPCDLAWFEGHFPDCAILPGVIQTHWAIEFGRKHYAIAGQFQSLSNVKFMRIIGPGMRLALELKFDAATHTLRFHYIDNGKACSAGIVKFSGPATHNEDLHHHSVL